ncbi:histidinol-phosphatase [Gorillibacterium sp. sgz5001074]|uniref:histidinol-phosphatase n=1 Tax=Gorillibacterium sp. sgz5001074 TaxID=3446695 RepID=UPI003F679D03
MIMDYHTHHNRCGHAVGTIEDYILRGMEIGVHQLGVSDHMPLFHGEPSTRHNGLAMGMEELPRYVEEVLRLKEKYREDIEVLLGIEADYIEGREEETARLLKPYPWDYVIGSVHYLGDWDLFDSRQQCRWSGQPAPRIYEAYYRSIEGAAASGLFDIIGHFDGIKRYGPPPILGEWTMQRAALEAVARAGIALELNTSGLRQQPGAPYPGQPVLVACAELGIPLTVGSDAHHPRHVAAGFDEAVQLLNQAGIREAAVFRGRRRSLAPVSGFALTLE